MEPAALEPVELPEFASADILLDDENVALAARIAGARDRVGLEADLAAHAHRHGDFMDLGDVAEAGRDRDPAGARIPALKRRGPELHVGAGLVGELARHGRDSVGDEGGRLLDVGGDAGVKGRKAAASKAKRRRMRVPL